MGKSEESQGSEEGVPQSDGVPKTEMGSQRVDEALQVLDIDRNPFNLAARCHSVTDKQGVTNTSGGDTATAATTHIIHKPTQPHPPAYRCVLHPKSQDPEMVATVRRLLSKTKNKAR